MFLREEDSCKYQEKKILWIFTDVSKTDDLRKAHEKSKKTKSMEYLEPDFVWVKSRWENILRDFLWASGETRKGHRWETFKAFQFSSWNAEFQYGKVLIWTSDWGKKKWSSTGNMGESGREYYDSRERRQSIRNQRIPWFS